MSCPAPDRVLDYLAHTIDATERDAVDAHVDGCAACRALLVELAITGDVPFARVDDPATIGRYQVSSRLGDGGMGTVFAAYDPQLDRRVAVKLVHPELAARGGLDRLLREGRVLARLSHPNVVAVYDADTDGDRVYVAMELVEGDTLAGWLRAPHDWRDIVAKFVAAGHGIAAAHRAGIVHRDVKPENVLIDRVGNAKVADFGLAGHSDTAVEITSSPSSRLTQPGTVMGTPMFMSPEQKAGREVGPATDQYSLCAALADALTGARIPAWLGRAIARGMAASPEARFSSIDELVAAIDPARRRRRTTRIVASVIATVVIAGGATAYALTRPDDDFAAACESATAERDALWPPVQDRVFAAIAGVGAPEINMRLDRAVKEQLLAQYNAQAKLCDQRPNSESSRVVFEQGMACLADRRAGLRSLVADLEHVTKASVRLAIPRIHTLPPTEDCSNEAILQAEHVAQATSVGRAKREEIRVEIAAMKAAYDAANYPESRDHEHRAIAAARTFGGVILARTLVDSSHVSAVVDGFATMERAMREAATLAEAAQADGLRANALSDLMAALARQPGREKEALAMRELVEAVMARSGAKQAFGAPVAQSAGVAYFRLGRVDEAIDNLGKALDLARRTIPKGDPRMPEYIYPVGIAYGLARKDAEAAKYHAEAYRTASEIWGPDSPNAVRYQIHLALKHGALGDCTTALAEAAHARGVLSKVMPASSPENLLIAELMGTCYYTMHQHEAALLEHRARQDALRAAGAATSVNMAETWVDIGDVELDRKHTQDAIDDYTRAITMIETVVGTTDARLAIPLSGLGNAELAAGHTDKALVSLERSLALFEAAKSAPAVAAEARFPLARALWPRDKVRARELATRARDGYREADGKLMAAKADAADAWLRDH